VFEENNILALLMAIFPVMIYSYLAYYLIPHTYIGNRRTRMYFVAGLLSPTIVYVFGFVFPYWYTPMIGEGIGQYAHQAYIQVALLEEVAKYITFWWVSSQRRNSKYDLPIATAYYAMMSAAGFAVIENIHYLIKFGNGVLFTRGITAIILHMVCGFFMGYFIAKSKTLSVIKHINPNNQRETMANDFYKLRKWACAGFGILAAVLIHGTYDFNLFLPFNLYPGMTLAIIIVSGLSIGYFMAKELILLSGKIRENNMKIDVEGK
jgi:RsiW-degrading membrane proteinase PrsW (M82 family)